jgi:hypothetical protein
MPDRLIALVARIRQIVTEPGCYHIVLVVDRDGLRWAVCRMGNMEGA